MTGTSREKVTFWVGLGGRVTVEGSISELLSVDIEELYGPYRSRGTLVLYDHSQKEEYVFVPF